MLFYTQKESSLFKEIIRRASPRKSYHFCRQEVHGKAVVAERNKRKWGAKIQTPSLSSRANCFKRRRRVLCGWMEDIKIMSHYLSYFSEPSRDQFKWPNWPPSLLVFVCDCLGKGVWIDFFSHCLVAVNKHTDVQPIMLHCVPVK